MKIRRAKMRIRVVPPDADTIATIAKETTLTVQQVGRIAIRAGLRTKEFKRLTA